MKMNALTANRLSGVAAAALGLTVPAIFIGRGALAACAGIAVVLFLATYSKSVSWNKIFEVTSSPIAIAVVIMFASWLPSMLESSDVAKSAFTLARTALFIAAAWFLYIAVVQSRRSGTVLRSLVVATLVVGCLSLAALLFFGELANFMRFKGWTGSTPDLTLKGAASAGMLATPVMVYAAVRFKGGWRLASLAVALLLVAIVYLTQSRAAMAGYFAMIFVVLALWFPALRTRWARTAMIAIVSVFVVVNSVWIYSAGKTFLEWDIAEETYLPAWIIDPPRQHIWQYTLNATNDHRMFGVGINVIEELPGAGIKNEKAGVYNIQGHPHNWIIEILGETGIVGLLATFVAIALFLWRRLTLHLQDRDFEGPAVICVWAGFWTSAVFNFSIWSSWWLVALFTLTAIVLAARDISPNDR